MYVQITDYERVSTVTPTQLGQFHCPRCIGVCNERSPERRRPPQKRREWDCSKCGRGWVEVPEWVETLEEAHQSAEDDLKEQVARPSEKRRSGADLVSGFDCLG